jgi:hypothetical protein
LEGEHLMAGPRLSFPRLQRRPSGERAPLPLSSAAEAIRANLAERCHQLAELDPRSLDLAAMVLALLHEGCRGRMTELRGTHSPEYRRRQLLGRDGLQVEGLCYLAIHAPEAVAAALRPLAAEVDHRLEPLEPDETAGVPVALAHVAREFGEATGGIIARLQDGLTGEEAVECDALVHELKQALALLEAALHNEAMGERTR